ncbi:MAG: RNA polymerase sporulation sigma factor SigK [Limnochordia bacterium]|jgi:RNA polymerase sporulation-specific sigma factor|nr:RNA polymerase sporulation sigma factor SigK [Bacillota bacterium]HPT92465.1 RNA polymerase sporulation sigma factor SigK [Limnochordia bacterium]HPZ30243.1 RNA polymerase sporulation sigma factor SigK [Limnochordia bacterium]HQD70221.1 RNA polymerase sporulation sigma factor SigK [Limnochordia bacterium]HXK96869.1 RNA polymerase sporulation sigma factor SigK [Limnochordia bacterium]
MLPALVFAAVKWIAEGIGLLVSYITNSNVFPKPLTPEEEKELLNRMKAGSIEARNALVERNLRLVAHIVKKFDKKGEDLEDLISIGTIGLIKAINTYDADKQTRLATYAARCIENEVLMHLRTTKKLKREVMLYDPIGSDREGNELSLIDIFGTDSDYVFDQVELQADQAELQDKLKYLSKREKQVLMLRYGLGQSERKTQREISQKMGISRSYVSRIEKRALSKLQEKMGVQL